MSQGSSNSGQQAIERILSSLFDSQSGGARREAASVDLSGITLDDLRTLISSRGGLRGFAFSGDDDDDDYEEDEDQAYYYPQARPEQQKQWFPPALEPQDAGVQLLNSGEFGYLGPTHRSKANLINTTKSILNAAYQQPARNLYEEIKTNLVPNTNGTTVATYDANIYTAQFSNDSSFYYTCAQDFRLHIFDMKKPPTTFGPAQPQVAPHSSGLKTSMSVLKEIKGESGNWTITDANLSSDNSRIIYASIMSTVYMTSTSPDGSMEQTAIPFGDRRGPHSEDHFGIWSCRFSADGNEVVAGGDGKIFVYDLLANRRTVKISAHSDDVNSCCWADTGSGNVLISASDDTFLKVWDRRSLGASQKPSGVLVGHTEGVTYVSAKGDGRYVISNGKDQALRLWDLRMMRSNKDFEAVERLHYGVRGFDYRRSTYPKPSYPAHPQDCSVMTYRGHSVLRTLIRCHFSPAETTGGQYLYSGSADGRIHVWSLDGRVLQVLDRSKTLPSSFAPSDPEHVETSGGPEANCVRDVSWHTQEPVLMSAAWSRNNGGTVIARHEWKGLSKMRYKLEDWAEREKLEAKELNLEGAYQVVAQRRLHVPGSYDDEDDEWVEEDD